MGSLCLSCKGRHKCGRNRCRHLEAFSATNGNRLAKVTTHIDSRAPAPFVGRLGYPHVSVGILAPPEKEEDAWEYDAPRHWAREDYKIDRLVELRSSLINSNRKMGVMERSPYLETVQEVGLASRPVDVEVDLKSPPKPAIHPDPHAAPTGPRVELTKAAVTSNAKIDRAVDNVHDDTDLRANSAIRTLYRKGYDDSFLTKLMSVGAVGVKANRRLVPTRWSITAVDDHLGKEVAAKVRDHRDMGYHAYFGGYLGNYYLVLFFPEPWSYELFEAYLPSASWNEGAELEFCTDYEPYEGRRSYAESCAGGYYAARLAVLEKLEELKRQATALVIRIITDEYQHPMGVWVCREATRKALLEKPVEFSEQKLMVRYAELILWKKFGVDISKITSQSTILKRLNTQSRLSSFM